MLDLAKLTAPQELAGLNQQRVHMQHVRDRCLAARTRVNSDQIVHSSERLRERLLDENVAATFKNTQRHRNVEVRWRADHRRVERPLPQGFFPVADGLDLIGLYHRLQEHWIRVAGGDVRAAGPFETAQVTLTNATTTND